MVNPLKSYLSKNNIVLKFVNHSKRVTDIAMKLGWLPGARYTNLRDIKSYDRLGFLDIEWENYDFKKHLSAAKSTYPILTVARDVEDARKLKSILDEAHALSEYADLVLVVPKDPKLANKLNQIIPNQFLLGYSVPTSYGKTYIKPEFFKRPVHLLGGRPDVQRELAERIPVVSFDNNRFTYDAIFGDYFDGEIFRPHPKGGYDSCIRDSIKNINKLWDNYRYHILD